MEIQKYTLYRYRLKLRRPLAVRGASVLEREGLLLKLEGTGGHVGWGEIAPLPGASRESLPVAEEAIRDCLPLCRGVTPDVHAILADPGLGERQDLPPAAAFGLEAALLGVVAHAAGAALRAILSDAPADRVPLNGLLGLGDPDLRERAGQLVRENVPAIKLKVGREDPGGEGERVRSLAAEVTGMVPLRLDANRAWSPAQAHAFCDAVAGAPVEYLEEPLRRHEDLPDFVAQGRVPVALDESLAEVGAALLERVGRPAAVVLKPALLGGIGPTLRMARQARALGAYVVISSLFESGVGTRILAEVAAAVNPDPVPCGLDPYRWIREDVVDAGLPSRGWEIDLSLIDRAAPIVRYDRLSVVTDG